MSEMLESVFRCVACEGKAYPCVLSIKTEANNPSPIVCTPTKCPFGGEKSNWVEVNE